MTVSEVFQFLDIDNYKELGSSGTYYADITDKKFNNLTNKLDNDKDVKHYDDEQLIGENQIRLSYSYDNYDISLESIFLDDLSSYTVRVESKLFDIE